MGKGGGKKVFSIIGAVVAAQFGFFGGGMSWIQRAVYGASLFGTVWSATHKPSESQPTATFNVAKNEIGMDRMIPIVYGTRKWAGGLETWQSTNSSTTNITKDIILAEGEITEILGVCANMRPVGNQVIFAIENVSYSDASISLQNSYLNLSCNGSTTSIHLQAITDVSADLSNEINCSTLKLAQYIEKLGNGWRICFNSGADLGPSSFGNIANSNCYKSPIRLYISTETGSSYTQYLGSSTQEPPSNYLVTGSYKNTAWVRANLAATSTLSFANPNITCVIRGKKIYDTRKLTTDYSENPAMCLRDYMLNKRFGMGRWVTSSMLDEDSFKEVADYCDEEISYIDAYGVVVKEPRYTLNLILAESRKHVDNIQDFLAVFGGFLIFTGNKIAIRIEKQDTVSAVFDENNIKKDSVKFTYTNLTDCPNRYNISYYDSAQDWSSIKVQVNDTADQYKRGNIVAKDVTLQGCTSQGQALRLGKMYKAINRLNGAGLTFSTGTTAMHLQPGDVIKFSYRVVADALFRIISISEQKGEYQIQCQQYNDTIYDDKLGSEISIQNITISSNPFVSEIPEVKNVDTSQSYYIQKDGTSVSTITLTWNNPSYAYYYKTYVYYSVDNGDSYTIIGSTTKETISLLGALVGKTYIFRLVVENTAQRFSSGILTGNIVCTGKDNNPNDLEYLVVAQDLTYLRFGFNTPTDKDFNHVEIRYGGSSWSDSSYLGDVYSNGKELPNYGIDNGSVMFRAKTVDNGGNYSTNDKTYTLTLNGLNYYKNVILTRDDVQLQDGTLENLTFTNNGIVVKIDSLEYKDIDTYDNLPSQSYGGSYTSDPGFIRYTSPTIDIGKEGKTGINFIFDYGFYDEYPVYGSNPDRTYGDYPNDTYDKISVNVDTVVNIRFSNDNVTWTEWQPYLAGEYVFRYIQYRLYATYSSTTMRGYINSLKQYYDVPDITMKIPSINIPVDGITITYADYGSDFYQPPEEISVMFLDAVKSVSPVVTNKTATSFTIKLYDGDGNLVSNNVQIVAKGY